jgi:OmpA-OmpF porin, OOP family
MDRAASRMCRRLQNRSRRPHRPNPSRQVHRHPPLQSLTRSLFGQLAGILESAGLTGPDALGGDGPFTLLAPTEAAFDAAFAELDADGFEMLTTDPALLRSVLLHHVAAGAITAADLESGPIAMLDGSSVEVDADALTFTSGDSVAGVEDPPTQLDIVASNGVIHAIDHLLLPVGLELSDPNDVTTTAAFDGGRFVLSGVVQTEAQGQQLATAAQQFVDPANIDDQLTVDATAVVEDDSISRLGGLIAATPPNLVSGTAQLVGTDLALTGVYLNSETNTALVEVAGTLDAQLNLTARPVANATTAQTLQDELNEFVRLNPVLFEQSSTNLTPAAAAVIEQIAARAQQLDGASITIVGFTDTDGDADANLQLSQGRALSVLTALVDQGLVGENLQSDGFGETNPVLDAAGVEDKAASRRVEFVVTPL